MAESLQLGVANDGEVGVPERADADEDLCSPNALTCNARSAEFCVFDAREHGCSDGINYTDNVMPAVAVADDTGELFLTKSKRRSICVFVWHSHID